MSSPKGSGSVNGFFSKVARFAVSKMAAFCYAVAVGAAGNLVFNYVQTHDKVPNVAATHREAPAPADANPIIAPAAGVVAKPTAAAPEPPTRPAALTAPAVPLPEPPTTVSLPSPAAMSPPPLKPAALPSAPPPALASPVPEPPPHPAPSNSAPAETAAAAAAVSTGETPMPPAAALPPLGPAIEVAPPPGSPVSAAVAPSLPISLLPDSKSPSADAAGQPAPVKPGPGSGGLY